MSGNKITVLMKYGVYEFPVTVEFTSYMQGYACFKIVNPLEAKYQNARIKIPKLEQQNIFWIFRDVFDILARDSRQLFKKWTDEYRGATGEVTEMEQISDKEEPSAVSEEPLSPEEHWLKIGKWQKDATPPSENWKWGEPIKQWYPSTVEEREKWSEIRKELEKE